MGSLSATVVVCRVAATVLLSEKAEQSLVVESRSLEARSGILEQRPQGAQEKEDRAGGWGEGKGRGALGSCLLQGMPPACHLLFLWGSLNGHQCHLKAGVWCTPGLPALGRLRQEDPRLKFSPGSLVT